jgi:hypothetical protein
MLNLSDFSERTTRKIERSPLADNLYIARAAIGIRRQTDKLAMYGFGAGRDPAAASTRAMFELYERLFFAATSHSPEALLKRGTIHGHLREWSPQRLNLSHFVYGASETHSFGGNGTAVHTDLATCVSNSRRELLERHLCAQFWYRRAFRPMRLPTPHWVVPLNNPATLLYGAKVPRLNAFLVMSIIDNDSPSFFAMGAALRSTLAGAIEHAFGEAAMLYGDFIQGRSGPANATHSTRRVLLLRDACCNQARRDYFRALLISREAVSSTGLQLDFHVNTVTFEACDGLFAARSFSSHATDPALLESTSHVPSLPLC